jgi:Concanavalin A-like lectin/glucanases superfamily/Putative Ig domain
MKTQSVSIGVMSSLLLFAALTRGADSLPHPILSISSNNGSAANTVLSTWTEAQYTNDFTPRYAPRNESYGFGAAVVSGDTGWSWNQNSPTNITSTPSGTVFPNPNTALYPIQTQAVTTFTGDTVEAPYYFRAGSTSSRSFVFNVIAYHQMGKRDGDLGNLAGAYVNTGLSQSSRDAYARRVAIALMDWGRWYPHYTLTGKNSATFINTSPTYVLSTDLQLASDHNGLAHEWNDTPLKAFDAIYDSGALTNLSSELGFDVRDFITTNVFFFEGDFFVNHVPVSVAIDSNLSGPYDVLPEVARVLNRPDYIEWMDNYLNATVTQKIRRDGVLEEGMGYSIGYLNANVTAALNTRGYFFTRPATNSEFIGISNRAVIYAETMQYGQAQWAKIALPNGQLPSFGDTPFNTYFSARNNGNSWVLPAYGTVSMGAGSGSQAVQVNQNFPGDNNHMRSDMAAFTLWAFNNEYLGNIRYYNGAIGRNWGEQITEKDDVTIDRVDETPHPDADTYGDGNLTLYEPGNHGLALTEIDGYRGYSSKASRFQRLMILNTEDLSRPYVLDVFRVTGGTNHDYTFHGSVRWTQTGQCSFPLVTNNNLYPMLEPGDPAWSLATDTPYYGFFRGMSSNTAPGNFYITFTDTNRATARDTRLWMTADPNTYNVYLGWTPVPARDNTVPTNFFNSMNLTRPSAIIRHRVTSGPLQDLFVSVIEPMNGGVSNIVSVQRLPMTGDSLESCGLKVTFKDGRADTYLVNLRNPKAAGANAGSATVSTTDGQYSLTGSVGLYSTNSSSASAWVVNGSHFQWPGGAYSPTNLYYFGGIVGSTRKEEGAAWDAFTTTTPLPTGTALQGKYLSLTHGTLSGYGVTNISELYQIDQVVQSNGLYYICLADDPYLDINNVLTISGSGSDIWNTADQFNYDYQSVSGDTTVAARVVSETGSQSYAKAGVMIRESLTDTSPEVSVLLTPNNGVAMEIRPTSGATSSNITGWISGQTPPEWVKLVRLGNSFTGYYSPDGVNWTQLASTNVIMNNTATVGLAVTAHSNSELNTAGFDNISLSGPLTDVDVGAVGIAGSVGNSVVSTEQVAPLRTFTGSNTFEIALSGWTPATISSAPTALKAIAGNGQVFLTWNAPSGATGYDVKRAVVNGGPYATIASPATAYFTDTDVTNGRAYFYVVSAVNPVGESADSAQASATPFNLASVNLVAHLTFDDGTANDSSGYGNNGILNGGATIVTDAERGKVLSLDGTSGYVDLGNAASLNLSSSSQATITAWVNVAVTTNHNTILSKGEWKEAYSLLAKGDTSPPNLLWTGNDTSVFSADPVPLNTWTHVAVTINGDLTSFYINGQLSGETNQDRGNPIDQTATDVCIGREQYSGSMPTGRWFFNGEMDDVRIYNKALTRSEIQSAMSNVVDTAPAFAGHPLAEAAANAGQPYDGSLAGTASDPDPGDTSALVFSKTTGPDWLQVASNGSLSGTPLAADAGTNVFDVRVTDSTGFFDETALNITVIPAPPQIAGAVLSGSGFSFSGSNGAPNATYYVLASTNVALPVSQWPVIGTNTFDAGGNFSFTNPPLNRPQTFYLLQLQ